MVTSTGAARFRRAAGIVATLLIVAGWALWLWPESLGGRTGYVTVSGESMLPALRPGDLVLLRREGTYRIGDVVTYRIPDGEFDGARIIHRIVGGTAAEGFVLQGDNKPDADPWRPRPSDIVGRRWIRLPAVGLAAATLRSPFVFAAVVGGAAFSLVYTRKPRRERRSEA